MKYPDELRLYFDTQLVDLYLKDGPAIADPTATAELAYVTVSRLVLRTAPYFGLGSANTELPFNFKITGPSSIRDLSESQISNIVDRIAGGAIGVSTFSDNVSIWRVVSTSAYDHDEALTPLSLLLQFAGQKIDIEVQEKTYSVTIPAFSPSDISGIMAVLAAGYLTFTKQE